MSEIIEDDKKPIYVKICLNCKSIWIHRVGMNYCGDCGTGSFERTHDSNYLTAENYPKVNPEFESMRNSIFTIGCNGWWLESYTLQELTKAGDRLGYGRLKQMVDHMYKIKVGT